MQELRPDELLRELVFMNELVQSEYSHTPNRQLLKNNQQACKQIEELILHVDLTKLREKSGK